MKRIKQSAVVCMMLLLTACGDKAAEPTQTASTSSTSQATVEDNRRGEEDYKKFLAWQASQEKALNDSTVEAVANLDKNDAKALQKAMNQALLTAIEKIKQDATNLEIKDPQVIALKEKGVEVMTLGAELMLESEKLNENPTQEAHKAFNELKNKLEQSAREGQAIESELNQKYGPAPQSEPASNLEKSTNN